MPTQEERLAALEQDTKTGIQDTNHTIIMLKGTIGSQGQDIKRILQRTDSLDGRLSVMDGRLNFLDGRLATVEQDVSQIKESLHEHTTLLTQILVRLPEKP